MLYYSTIKFLRAIIRIMRYSIPIELQELQFQCFQYFFHTYGHLVWHTGVPHHVV